MIKKFNEYINESNNNLPKIWVDHLINLPETGMGYQIVDITMNDGSVFNGVKIINSSIIKSDEYIDVDNIKDISLS
jgi:hypothetical protein